MSDKTEATYTTELVRVRVVHSEGLLGTITVTDYKGMKYVVVRNTLDNKQCKECEKEWVFMKMEHKDGKLIFMDYVVCDKLTYNTLIKHHREAMSLIKRKIAERGA